MTPALTAQQVATLAATERAIAEGHVLHVRAERLRATRRPPQDAMPAVDLTLGPDARGGFAVWSYARVPGGEVERFGTANEAVQHVRRLLTWDRLAALRAALTKALGPAEQPESRHVELDRGADAGARLAATYAHRPGISGPLFGPSGTGAPAWLRVRS